MIGLQSMDDDFDDVHVIDDMRERHSFVCDLNSIGVFMSTKVL